MVLYMFLYIILVMNNTEITKFIPYSTILNIIRYCEDKTTKELITFQYVFGCRAGELAREYTHKYYKSSERFDRQDFVSVGAKNSDFNIKDGEEISFRKPNFKQAKVKGRDKKISDVARFSTFMIRSAEPELFRIVYNKIKEVGYNETIFNIKESMIRKRIDKELKKYDVNYSSHWLRHSRARHIAELTGDPSAVQSLLGHADMNTTMRYINRLSVAFRKAVEGGRKVEDLIGKKVGDK